MEKDLLKPWPARVLKVSRETPSMITVEFEFLDKRHGKEFLFLPGKFMKISLFGLGEMPISISSNPYRNDSLSLTVLDVGRISHDFQKLKKGDIVGLRGPFGKGFPVQRFRKKNIVFIAGGCGFSPVLSVIQGVLHKREQFNELFLFFGARDEENICFKRFLKKLEKKKDFNCFTGLDSPKTGKYYKGFVTDLLEKTSLPAENSVAVICGPEIMQKIALQKLLDKGFKAENVFLSLERLMHCGIGKCAHCNIGPKYVCIDGPVFNGKEYLELKKEK